MDLSVVPYGETGNGQVDAQAAATPRPPKYRECLRNHAAAIGGQAFDGCGEFMPAGAHGSIDALKCAACSCHRNFHRRDDNGNGPPRRTPLLLTPPPFPPFLPQPMPVAYQQIRPAGIYEPNRAGSETPPRREDPEPPRRPKRNRTRFTPEQKEKMQAFAEKLGWRIHKHDDVALKEFCVEVGIKRHVLKVWIHNNKNNLAQATKRDGGAAAAAVPAPISV